MLLIKNALLVDAYSNLEAERDVLIENGKIKAVDSPGSFDNQKCGGVIDAGGLWLLPGLIDLHVHLREPGFEWKETVESGVRAAVAGGYTTICAMPNTNPVNDKTEITKFILNQADKAGLAKLVPIGAVSQRLKGQCMSPISELYQAGCPAFSDDGEPVFDSGLMRRALEWSHMHDAVICCHEEDKCLSCGGAMNESALSYRLGIKGMPTIAEDVMVARDIELARYTGGKVHICHISSDRGVELVRRAKNDGINVTCEVTPHHLSLTEESVSGYDTNFKMSPPLRTEKIRQALIEGLKDGTIDVVASDHAPHEVDSKLQSFQEASMGILGLQTSLPLMLEFYRAGVLSRKRLAEVLATRPAEIFGLEQGKIQVGSPADLVLIDPEYKWTFDKEKILSKSFNSPFIGKEFQGIADTVIVDGRVVKRNKELI